MITTENKNFLRIILLLYDAASFILRHIVVRELEKRGDDIDNLLKKDEFENKLKHQLHFGKSQVEKLFPSNGKSNIQTWDSQMLAVVGTLIFRSTLSRDEKFYINYIKHTRNTVAHKKSASYSEDDFVDEKEGIIKAISILASSFDSTVQENCRKLISSYCSDPFDHLDKCSHVQLAIKHLEEETNNGELLRQILDAIKVKHEIVRKDIEEHAVKIENKINLTEKKICETQETILNSLNGLCLNICNVESKVTASKEKSSLELKQCHASLTHHIVKETEKVSQKVDTNRSFLLQELQRNQNEHAAKLESKLEELKQLFEQTSRTEGHCTKQIKFGTHTHLTVDGPTQEWINTVETVLKNVFDILLNNVQETGQNSETERAVEEFLNYIKGLKDVELKSVERKCILLAFECLTYDSLRELIEFVNSNGFLSYLESIARALQKDLKIPQKLVISSEIPVCSLQLVFDDKSSSIKPESKKGIALSFECTSIDGLDAYWRLFVKGDAKPYIDNIAATVLSGMREKTSLSTTINLQEFEEALTNLEATVNKEKETKLLKPNRETIQHSSDLELDIDTIQTRKRLPDAPTDLQAVNDAITETTVTLTWKPGNYRKYEQGFVISYRPKYDRNTEWTRLKLLDNEQKSTMIYKVENLNERTTYEFKIRATNKIGQSQSSDIITVTTKEMPVTIALDEILEEGKNASISRLEQKSQMNIDFKYRRNRIPKHPFFPEMLVVLSSVINRYRNIQRLIFLNMGVGLKAVKRVELTKNDMEQISRYEKEKTHIVQLCTQTIGDRLSCIGVRFDLRDFVSENDSETEELKKHEPFADRVILNMICCELTKNNTAINTTFPSIVDGEERPSLVSIVKEEIKISEFRGFRLTTYMASAFFKDSIKAENAFEKESKEYKDIFNENFTDINMTLAHHYENILSKHSNIEAMRVSFVKQSKTNLLEICPCIVIYCQVKSVVPYKEELFPQTLCHPYKSKSFKTDVRIGYFSLCPYFALSSKEWNKELAMGCSIGEMNGQIAATIGPFVEVIETQETCFLTVRHLFPPFERNVVGVKVVQPADCDLPPVQQNPMPGRECGEVVAAEVNNEIDAALVKIADKRKPSRGHCITVTREELNKTGLSPTQIPTFDDGSVIDVVGLTIKDHATTRPILKIGAKTGLTKGMLTTVEGVVKANDDDISLLFNGIANPRYFRKQLFVDFIKNVFCQPGDSGSAVFLLDADLKLHCVGIVLGMMSDFTAVVTPINTILNELGHKYNNRTLKLKNFRLEQMDVESQS